MNYKTNFASDNYSGIHPDILAAIGRVNGGDMPSYGADEVTADLSALMREIFGPDTHTFPVLTGTGANVLSLSALSPRWAGVICAESAHINVDENGAPERMAGLKLLSVPSADGKLTVADIAGQLWASGVEHHAQPLVVSITQSTETGRCYTPEEITDVTTFAHEHGMQVHMDGSRLANAAAYLNTGLAEISRECGIDALSLGGTKNGLMGAEAVLVWDEQLAEALRYTRKFMAQLVSKMRFLSVQLLHMYGTDLWRENAQHANAMATLLAQRLEQIPEVQLTQEQYVNVVFAQMAPEIAQRLREKFAFYDWQGPQEVRLMTNFTTQPEDIDAFCTELLNAIADTH